MSHESTELKLFIDNDYALYSGQRKSIVDNLLKKKNAGKYDSAKSVKLWGYLAESGAKKYAKEFARASEWHTIFSVADRKQVARELRDDFESSYREGEFDDLQRKLETKAQKKGREQDQTYPAKHRVKTIRELSGLPGPFVLEGESATSFHFFDGAGKEHYFEHDGSELTRSAFRKVLSRKRGTKKGQVRKTARRAYKPAKKKRTSTCRQPGGKCTKADVERIFKVEVMPSIVEAEDARGGRLDKPGRREMWNNWIDGLQKDGTITERQADTWGHPKWLETWRGKR